MQSPWNASTTRVLRRGAAVFALAAGLCALFLPRLVETVLAFELVTGAAEARVAESLERNTVTFLSLSGIKAIMASIEGSSVGVGFHFEIGDLIQPAYDYVDFVWHAFLYALGALGLYKLLMETGILELGFAILGIGLFAWGVGALELGPADALRRAGRRVALLGLLVAYVLPISLLLSHVVANRYLVPLEKQTAARIEETRAPLREAAARLGSLRDKISLLEPGKSVDAVTEEAKHIATEATDAVWARLQAFLAFVLILLVELLLLPFLSAFLIYRVLSFAIQTRAR